MKKHSKSLKLLEISLYFFPFTCYNKYMKFSNLKQIMEIEIYYPSLKRVAYPKRFD